MNKKLSRAIAYMLVMLAVMAGLCGCGKETGRCRHPVLLSIKKYPPCRRVFSAFGLFRGYVFADSVYVAGSDGDDDVTRLGDGRKPFFKRGEIGEELGPVDVFRQIG